MTIRRYLRVQPERADRVRALAEQYVNAGRFNSIAWSVRQGDLPVIEGEAGFADVQRVSVVSRDAIYRIYSMTKPVVAIAALQLIEENKLRLSDSVAAYIPQFGKSQVLHGSGKLETLHTSMTIEHLLSHRSGLSYDFLPDCPVAMRYRAANVANDASRSLEEMVDVVASEPLAFQPGSRWQYSYSTDVLAHVLEKVSGLDLAALLQERVFSPLAMQDTGFSVAAAAQSRLLPMFGVRGLGEMMVDSGEANQLVVRDEEQTYPSSADNVCMRGGHGLFSTLADYTRIVDVLRHGCGPDGRALLSAPMLDWMWRNRLPADQLPLKIGSKIMLGYGWTLFGRVMLNPGEALNLSAYGEGGWAGAASTYFWIDRASDVSGIVMSQYLGSTIPLGAEIQSASYQAFVTAEA